jgi:nitrite reductase (NAD(P)H)
VRIVRSINGKCADRDSEKLIKLDAKRTEYQIIVIGEEPHLAYNRVGLTSYFDHRKVEQLYLNPQSWVLEHGI